MSNKADEVAPLVEISRFKVKPAVRDALIKACEQLGGQDGGKPWEQAYYLRRALAAQLRADGYLK